MDSTTVELAPPAGSLVLRTGVEGRAARMGHSLELAVEAWEAAVELDDGEPVRVRFRCVLSSMRVASATGGVLPVTELDRRTIQRNALRTLGADQHPYVEFEGDIVPPAQGSSKGSYGLSGTLTIAGTPRPFSCSAATSHSDGQWEVVVDTSVRQSDFGITAYSQMLGALRVADEVGVRFRAAAAG